MTKTGSELEVETRECPGCGQSKKLTVSMSGWVKWNTGQIIQRALPELSRDDRERLITGYCPRCWTQKFGRDEETM